MRKPVILASASARRRTLLKKIGINPRIIPSRIPENLPARFSPAEHVIRLAMAKAEAVAARLNRGVVIGADTIAVLDGKIIGKPRSAGHARKILSLLSGTKHAVYTGIAVIDVETGRRFADLDKAVVITRKIPAALIARLARKNLDKAGAYAVQEERDLIVKRIEGDFYTVVGLPLEKLKRILALCGIITTRTS